MLGMETGRRVSAALQVLETTPVLCLPVPVGPSGFFAEGPTKL